jgi:hypothetical protein
MSDPLSRQVGGEHYQRFDPQPAVWLHKNGVPWMEANVIKYLLRFRNKDGKKDLLKAQHYLEMLIETEYPEARP